MPDLTHRDMEAAPQFVVAMEAHPITPAQYYMVHALHRTTCSGHAVSMFAGGSVIYGIKFTAMRHAQRRASLHPLQPKAYLCITMSLALTWKQHVMGGAT